MEKYCACPFAAKIVEDTTGLITLRNDDREDGEQLVFLPPNTAMRGLCLDWIHARRWDPIKNVKTVKSLRRKMNG